MASALGPRRRLSVGRRPVGVLLRCGGRHRRACTGNRSGREGNRGGGREIDWGAGNRWPSREIDRPFIDLAIWGEREREKKGERAHLELAAAATPPRVRRPRRERDSSAPSASRARILCAVLSASATPPAGLQAAPAAGPQAPPSSSLARRLLPPPSSCLCICVGPQAPPSSCLCICCLAHAFMLLSC